VARSNPGYAKSLRISPNFAWTKVAAAHRAALQHLGNAPSGCAPSSCHTRFKRVRLKLRVSGVTEMKVGTPRRGVPAHRAIVDPHFLSHPIQTLTLTRMI
jgi:hypothetical protein